MELMRICQLTIFVLLAMYGNMGNAESCGIQPIELEKVKVVAYINGGTVRDREWWIQYCSLQSQGMSWDTYSPTTVKVGAEVICAGEGDCKCPNTYEPEADCTTTFEHACVAQILGEVYMTFSCCMVVCVDPDCAELRGFQECVDEYELTEKLAECMAKKGADGPQEIAVKNSLEVTNKGINFDYSSEPIFFFEEIFTPCVNENAWQHWLFTICAMLKPDIALSIQFCVDIFSQK